MERVSETPPLADANRMRQRYIKVAVRELRALREHERDFTVSARVLSRRAEVRTCWASWLRGRSVERVVDLWVRIGVYELNLAKITFLGIL